MWIPLAILRDFLKVLLLGWGIPHDFLKVPLLGWRIPHDFPESSPAMDLKSPRVYSPFRFHLSPTLDARCWRLRVKWHRTRHRRQTTHTHTPAGGTELHKLFALYYYKAPLGRIPDCMNKPFQHSAGAYMLSYSKREWNSGLLQSLSRALITRRKCSLTCKGPLVSRLCPSSWQNILFVSSTSPPFLLWPH